jgi:hypothetical protein
MHGERQMETQKINWLDLSDSQKAIVLEQARTYLRQQVAEAKFGKSILNVLHKHELIE